MLVSCLLYKIAVASCVTVEIPGKTARRFVRWWWRAPKSKYSESAYKFQITATSEAK